MDKVYSFYAGIVSQGWPIVDSLCRHIGEGGEGGHQHQQAEAVTLSLIIFPSQAPCRLPRLDGASRISHHLPPSNLMLPNHFHKYTRSSSEKIFFGQDLEMRLTSLLFTHNNLEVFARLSGVSYIRDGNSC